VIGIYLLAGVIIGIEIQFFQSCFMGGKDCVNLAVVFFEIGAIPVIVDLPQMAVTIKEGRNG
jgi:hypothetical protein